MAPRTDDGRPTSPRVEPLEMASANDTQSELLGRLGGDGALNLFRTLAHNPGVTKPWLRFGGQLLQHSSLRERERELVILRVALLCRNDYEWGQHVAIALNAGISEAEIIRVGRTELDGWSEHEAVLLSAVDQLIFDHFIDESTWEILAADYSNSQLVELTLLAGHYAMLAGMLSSLGVQTESPLPRLGEASIGTADDG